MLLSFYDYLISHKSLFLYISMGVFLILLIVLFVIFYIKKMRSMSRKNIIRHMTTIAIFATLSIIFYLTFKFSLPIFPSFLEINFSNLPILLGGFLLGPVEGMIIIIIRTIIVLPFSHTFFVGELADVIISSSIMLISSIIYFKNKTKKGAIYSLIFSNIVWVTVACLANYVILIPAYITLFFNGDINAFMPLLSVIPGVTEYNYKIKYILFGNLPFNFLLSVTVNVCTYLVYKKLSILFHKFDDWV